LTHRRSPPLLRSLDAVFAFGVLHFGGVTHSFFYLAAGLKSFQLAHHQLLTQTRHGVDKGSGFGIGRKIIYWRDLDGGIRRGVHTGAHQDLVVG